MPYSKKDYFEDDFVMNHYERRVDDFTHVAGVSQGSTQASATVTFTAALTIDDTITLTSASGRTIVYTCKASANFSNNEFARSASSPYGADSLKSAIEHVDGHAGEILVSISGAALTLTQEAVGGVGNDSLYYSEGKATVSVAEDGNVIEINSGGFSGGITGPVPFSYASKGVRLRTNPNGYKTNIG